jgi:hypothetical protein
MPADIDYKYYIKNPKSGIVYDVNNIKNRIYNNDKIIGEYNDSKRCQEIIDEIKIFIIDGKTLYEMPEK